MGAQTTHFHRELLSDKRSENYPNVFYDVLYWIWNSELRTFSTLSSPFSINNIQYLVKLLLAAFVGNFCQKLDYFRHGFSALVGKLAINAMLFESATSDNRRSVLPGFCHGQIISNRLFDGSDLLCSVISVIDCPSLHFANKIGWQSFGPKS